MKLLDVWRSKAYDERADKSQLQPIWNTYFALEKGFYQKLLPEKERIVIFNRYNFARRQRTATLRELGESLGVSTETVRQIELRAVKHLQKVCEGDMNCVL